MVVSMTADRLRRFPSVRRLAAGRCTLKAVRQPRESAGQIVFALRSGRPGGGFKIRRNLPRQLLVPRRIRLLKRLQAAENPRKRLEPVRVRCAVGGAGRRGCMAARDERLKTAAGESGEAGDWTDTHVGPWGTRGTIAIR